MMYPDCPKCGNSNQTLYVEDVEIAGVLLKSIYCPTCGPLYIYKDYDVIVEELKEKVSDLESDVDSLK